MSLKKKNWKWNDMKTGEQCKKCRKEYCESRGKSYGNCAWFLPFLFPMEE